MTRPLLFSTLLLVGTLSGFSQSPTPTEPKKDLFGMGGLTKDRPKDAKTEITAKKQATFDNATSLAEFEGSVVVVDPQFTLYCERLKVTLSKDRKGMELVEAFAAGRDKQVVIVQNNKDANGESNKSVGRADKVVYNPATGDVTLTGMPSIQQGINNQIATDENTVMILNRGGKLDTKGGSKTVIVETSEPKN